MDTTDFSLTRPFPVFQRTEDASRLIDSSQEREQTPVRVSSFTPKLHPIPQQV